MQRNGCFGDRAERGYLFVERRPSMDGYAASLLASDKSDKTADDARLKHVRFGHQSVYGLKNCPTCMITRTRRPAIRSKPYVSAEAPLQTVCADVAGPVSVSVDGQRQRCPSVTGALYTLFVQDEYSRHVWSDTLPNKSDVTTTTIDTLQLIQNELSLTVRRFHSDGGSEFVNRTMGEYLRSKGIRQTYTTADTPSHNGKVERVNQTIMAITRSIMEHCQLSVRYWNYAVQYATMIYNYTPLKAIGGVSPCKKLYGKEPNISKLKVFGCNVVYVLPDKDRSKIQATSARGSWLGYSRDQPTGSYVLTADRRVIVTHDIRFDESSFSHLYSVVGATSLTDYLELDEADDVNDLDWTPSFTQSHQSVIGLQDEHNDGLVSLIPDPVVPASSSCDDVLDIIDAVPLIADTPSVIKESTITSINAADLHPPSPSVNPSPAPDSAPVAPDASAPIVSSVDHASDLSGLVFPTELPVSRYGRARKPTQFYGKPSSGDYGLVTVDDRVFDPVEPTSYQDIKNHCDRDKWYAACDEEIASITAKGVYQLVKRRPGMRVIKSGWVLKVKRDENNLPIRYKARFVAKGYSQRHGIDYHETFSPVVKHKSIRLMLCVAVQHNLEMKQMDYHTAFLNGELEDEEEIYVEQPEGYSIGDDLVWRLIKSLYGLKQSPHVWYKKLTKSINRLVLIHVFWSSLSMDILSLSSYQSMWMTLSFSTIPRWNRSGCRTSHLSCKSM